MTGERPIDIAIAGGGLAGGLAALALRALRPELRVVLVEEAQQAGGNHVWSCFAEDVAPADRWLIEPLIINSWPGTQVRFPGTDRQLDGSYASLTNERLGTVLHRNMPEGDLRFGHAAKEVRPHQIVLDDGRSIEARAVIDARGPGDLSALELGWQKFVGLSWKCHEPHGQSRPVIMDATVDQIDGYRFVYTLPSSAHDLFIEDTYYADSPDLNEPVLRERIAHYARAQGWMGAPAGRCETGVLPVCMDGDFERYWQGTSPGVAKIGLRGAFFHALTGYSLPDAVRVALALARMPDLTGAALHDRVHALASRHWRSQRFYRLLSKLLFRAAEPEERWRVLARFYRLDPHLIGRFYAGQSTMLDRFRILTGKPPVPIARAIKVLGAPHR